MHLDDPHSARSDDSTLEGAESDWRRPWANAAKALPALHAALSTRGHADFVAVLETLPEVPVDALDSLADEEARLVAIDVLMVEAEARTQGLWSARPDLESRAMAAAAAVAGRLDIPPIISYPLYIVHNPPSLAQIRRFTPLSSEVRFIRMHQQIEASFESSTQLLRDIVDAADWRAAFHRHFPAIKAQLTLANRVMSGFRDPVRMPPQEFAEGFRPYFGTRAADEATGRLGLEGPSGLQSPAFRVLTMTLGLADTILDGWTAKIAAYHQPQVRNRLAAVMRERNEGRSLAGRVERALHAGHGDDIEGQLPKLHPSYGQFLSTLVPLAEARGYIQTDVASTLEMHQVHLGHWPQDEGDAPPPAVHPSLGAAWTRLAASDSALVGALIDLEVLWLGFCLEHIATTAYQIGHVAGTGGTSGVEFLALATFRRLFPGLWLSGVGLAVVA